MRGGFPVEFVLDLPIGHLVPLLKSLDRVTSKHLVEQCWLDLVSSQGSGKDLKRALGDRTTRSKRQPPADQQAPGLKSLVAQMGVKGKKRKKA